MTTISPGTVLEDRYRVERLLGEGTFARVYLARHVTLLSTHAVKVLNDEFAVQPGVRARFLSEGRIQAQLRHPHLVAVTDIVVDPPSLVLEYIEGTPLDEWRPALGRPLVPDEILGLMVPVLEAIGVVHQVGIVHRDIKPENIIVSRDSRGRLRPMVSDFGIAKVQEGSALISGKKQTEAGMRMGTPAYMSPEQVRGDPDLGRASDIFALGVLLYELIAGQHPFLATNDFETMRNIVDGRRRPFPSPPSEAVGRCIERALAREVGGRFADCGEFRAALEEAFGDEPTQSGSGVFKIPEEFRGVSTPAPPPAPPPPVVAPPLQPPKPPAAAPPPPRPQAPPPKPPPAPKPPPPVVAPEVGVSVPITGRSPPLDRQVRDVPPPAPPPALFVAPPAQPPTSPPTPGAVSDVSSEDSPPAASGPVRAWMIAGVVLAAGLLAAAVAVGGAIAFSRQGSAPSGSAVVQPSPTPAAPSPVPANAPSSSAASDAEIPLLPGFVSVPTGRFTMGAPVGEIGRFKDEIEHPVVLTRAYAIATTEVTRGLWESVVPGGAAPGQGSDLPVGGVSWLDAISFCNALSAASGRAPAYFVDGAVVRWSKEANGYRLPTEAEWEFAARAQQLGAFAGGDSAGAVAWFVATSNGSPRAPSTLAPNRLGVYDMSGNVGEWVWDRYGDYPAGEVSDPDGAPEGETRVIRGGSYKDPERAVRVAYRKAAQPDSRSLPVGVRLVVTGTAP